MWVIAMTHIPSQIFELNSTPARPNLTCGAEFSHRARPWRDQPPWLNRNRRKVSRSPRASRFRPSFALFGVELGLRPQGRPSACPNKLTVRSPPLPTLARCDCRMVSLIGAQCLQNTSASCFRPTSDAASQRPHRLPARWRAGSSTSLPSDGQCGGTELLGRWWLSPLPALPILFVSFASHRPLRRDCALLDNHLTQHDVEVRRQPVAAWYATQHGSWFPVRHGLQRHAMLWRCIR